MHKVTIIVPMGRSKGLETASQIISWNGIHGPTDRNEMRKLNEMLVRKGGWMDALYGPFGPPLCVEPLKNLDCEHPLVSRYRTVF